MDVCSNGHFDIVKYLIERGDCDLSVICEYETFSDQPTLHAITR